MYVNPLVVKANKLARELKAQGSPVSGPAALALWEICSCNHSIGVLTAKKLYLKAGYIPFRGFPLERKPDRAIARAEAAQAYQEYAEAFDRRDPQTPELMSRAAELKRIADAL